MDTGKLKTANDKFDSEFADEHPKFNNWWHHHPHCDEEAKWAVPARVAWKCQRYRDEYMEARAVGLT